MTVNASVAAGVFEKPVDKATEYTFASGNSARNIPLELNIVHIFTQVKVNGSEPMWFLFDTGASVTVLSTAATEKLGLELAGKIEARGAGEGSEEAYFVENVNFELPGVKLAEQTAVAIGLERLEPLFGRPIDGILGYDMISRFVVELDYENQLMHLYERESFSYDGNGKRIPISLDGSTPFVEATVTMMDGSTATGRFLVDTGAGATVGFTAPFTKKNDLLASVPHTLEFEGGAGIGGDIKALIGRIKSVDMGGLKFFDPVVGFSQDKAGVGANPNMAGIIGGEILSRCTVIFDYDRASMILEPNANFEDPYNFTMSGLVVQTGGRGDWQTLTVRKVMADSPAAEAGIQVGDVIEMIDGRPAAEYSIHTLDGYFKRDGEVVTLKFIRDGRAIEKQVKLTKAI